MKEVIYDLREFLERARASVERGYKVLYSGGWRDKGVLVEVKLEASVPLEKPVLHILRYEETVVLSYAQVGELAEELGIKEYHNARAVLFRYAHHLLDEFIAELEKALGKENIANGRWEE